MVSPVCGFLPSLAARSDVSKVPKPTSCTFSPFFICSATTSVKALSAFSASFLDNSVLSAIAAISSCLIHCVIPPLNLPAVLYFLHNLSHGPAHPIHPTVRLRILILSWCTIPYTGCDRPVFLRPSHSNTLSPATIYIMEYPVCRAISFIKACKSHSPLTFGKMTDNLTCCCPGMQPFCLLQLSGALLLFPCLIADPSALPSQVP